MGATDGFMNRVAIGQVSKTTTTATAAEQKVQINKMIIAYTILKVCNMYLNAYMHTGTTNETLCVCNAHTPTGN